MFKKITAIKFFCLIILTIITIILLKNNEQFKILFKKHVMTDNLSFASINNLYTKQFGSPIPFSEYFNKTETVFYEKLTYTSIEKYNEGYNLVVDSNYLVPAIDSGIITFIGVKENFGKTVIVEQSNGVVVWYSNLENINVTIYDYITKSSLIGDVNNNLYLVFYKDGEVIGYEDYI